MEKKYTGATASEPWHPREQWGKVTPGAPAAGAQPLLGVSSTQPLSPTSHSLERGFNEGDKEPLTLAFAFGSAGVCAEPCRT